MRSVKKWLLNAVFFLIVIASTLYGVFHGENLPQIRACLLQADARWWLLGVLFVVVFILCEALVLFTMLRPLGVQARLSHCFLYSFTGFFFSCITPMAGGGQPAQAWLMKKDGIPYSSSLPVLLMVTIAYKSVLVAVGAYVLLLRPAPLIGYLAPILGWCWLGLLLTTGAVGAYLALIFRPRLLLRPCLWLLRQTAGRFFPAREQALRARLTGGLSRFGDAADYLRTHPRVTLGASALTFFQRFVLFSVTFLACRSFGLRAAPPVTVSTLQAMIAVAADMLPLPGGMGITESLFLRIFDPICTEALTVPVLVVSRGVSYYSQLIISGFFTLLTAIMLGKRERGRQNDRVL